MWSTRRIDCGSSKIGNYQAFSKFGQSRDQNHVSPLLSVPKGTPSHNDDQDSEVASSDDEVLDLECIVARKGGS